MLDIFILAAGTIRKKIHFLKYIYDSPALIPINTEPIAGAVIKFYRQKVTNAKLHLAVNDDVLNIVQRYLSVYENDINIIAINNKGGVINTLRDVIYKVNPTGVIIVNLVTTIPSVVPRNNEVLVAEEHAISNEWSSVQDNGIKVNFNFKESVVEKKGNAFTGVFCVSTKLLIKALSQLDDNKSHDLLYVVEEIHKRKKLAFKKVQWMDCGHEMNYYKAKINLISSRSFNSIEVDSIKGTLRKRSNYHKTLKDEIDFILHLPKELSIYFPRVLKKPDSNDHISEVEMEYYGYPSLSEYMLFWDLNKGLWANVFNALTTVIKDFQKYKSPKITRQDYLNFYWGKTYNRLCNFKSQLGEKDLIFSDKLSINEKQYKNIHLLEKEIVNKLTIMYNNSVFNIMHGDLCFNNILYDLYSGTIRLIDARGSFGDKMAGIYGDQCYDIAKISHSVIGGYDYIVNGFFSFEEKNNTYKYWIFERMNHKSLIDLNVNLIEYFGYNITDVMFFMSLLFISMTPLHNDNINRQKLFYLHGIRFLNESLGILKI
ncbi:MAG: hypothetical protein H8E13_01800 [Actinobacteria bacterium]|nr:hypothetical protein [Actinomycetota bacterium]